MSQNNRLKVAADHLSKCRHLASERQIWKQHILNKAPLLHTFKPSGACAKYSVLERGVDRWETELALGRIVTHWPEISVWLAILLRIAKCGITGIAACQRRVKMRWGEFAWHRCSKYHWANIYIYIYKHAMQKRYKQQHQRCIWSKPCRIKCRDAIAACKNIVECRAWQRTQS